MTESEKKKCERAGGWLVVIWLSALAFSVGAQAWMFFAGVLLGGVVMGASAAFLFYPDTQQ